MSDNVVEFPKRVVMSDEEARQNAWETMNIALKHLISAHMNVETAAVDHGVDDVEFQRIDVDWRRKAEEFIIAYHRWTECEAKVRESKQ